MLCLRCGVEVGESLKHCDECAAWLAENAEETAPSAEHDLPSEINDDVEQEQLYFEDEPTISLRKVFVFLFIPVLIGLGMVLWVLAENDLIGEISKKSGVDKLVGSSISKTKPSPRVISKKIKFELGVDGVTGLLIIQGTQIPVWGHDIALQQPERNLAIKFAEKNNSAQSIARPASQKLAKPLLLKLRLRPGKEVCSMKSLAGYLMLIEYGGETMRISRLNNSTDPIVNEVSDLECTLRLGAEMRGKFKGEAVLESGIAVAWNLVVEGQIEALE